MYVQCFTSKISERVIWWCLMFAHGKIFFLPETDSICCKENVWGTAGKNRKPRVHRMVCALCICAGKYTEMLLVCSSKATWGSSQMLINSPVERVHSELRISWQLLTQIIYCTKTILLLNVASFPHSQIVFDLQIQHNCNDIQNLYTQIQL